MNLWAKYIKEREGYDSLETEHGFATYIISGEDCYIRDIYVDPDFRQTGIASDMADEITKIAKASGCKRLLGSVCPNANGVTTSMKVLLSYGFEFLGVKDLIYFKKEI
jgi:ribosomal protein S18 acetylase RimI-like enzyme